MKRWDSALKQLKTLHREEGLDPFETLLEWFAFVVSWGNLLDETPIEERGSGYEEPIDYSQELERFIFDRINEKRLSRNLPAYQKGGEHRDEIAREHSEYMIDTGFFSTKNLQKDEEMSPRDRAVSYKKKKKNRRAFDDYDISDAKITISRKRKIKVFPGFGTKVEKINIPNPVNGEFIMFLPTLTSNQFHTNELEILKGLADDCLQIAKFSGVSTGQSRIYSKAPMDLLAVGCAMHPTGIVYAVTVDFWYSQQLLEENKQEIVQYFSDKL